MAGGTYDLVQPIVVTGDGAHEDTVRAAAMASVQAWLHTDSELWEPWLAGSFAKTVRRVKSRPKQRAVRDQMEALGYRSWDYACGGGEPGAVDVYAEAFAPMPAGDLPRPVARLQVSGLDRPRSGRWADPVQPVVVVVCINAVVSMSTGKTAAQASHALMAWLLHCDPEVRVEFRLGNVSFLLREVPGEMFELLWPHAGRAAIADNGHTEVEPGTRTALAVSPDVYEKVMTDGED